MSVATQRTALATTSHDHRSPSPAGPNDLGHHLSSAARRRRPTNFTMFHSFYDVPGLLDISGGYPHPSLFPLSSIGADLKEPDVVGQGQTNPIRAEGSMLAESLQYGQACGIHLLARWVNDYTKQRTQCLYDGGFATVISGGNSDGWTKVLATFSDEWRESDPLEARGGVLVEQFSFVIATEAARVRGLNVVPVTVDNLGLCPEALETVLRDWDFKLGKRPSMLYTISHGQNPTGSVASPTRRAAIYDICCKYDIIIVADEPYIFLQFDSPSTDCYLAHDYQGRVLQLDSFSKCFAPGMRLGWITGQPKLIKAVYSLVEEATQSPAGPSQLIMLQSLLKWGIDGWNAHLSALSEEYTVRRDILCNALEPYATCGSQQLMQWSLPRAGMCLWVRLEWQNHPMFMLGTEVLAKSLWMHHTQQATPALVCPGAIFAPNLDMDHQGERYWYFRLSYASTSKDLIKAAAEAVGASVQAFWSISSAEILTLANQYPA